jgi:hypothetical protein
LLLLFMKSLLTLLFSLSVAIAEDDLPINRLQFIGTHNSYHVAPTPAVHRLIEGLAKGEGDAIAYTHRPLREQLTELGIRQIELDLYHDPVGGLYARPLGAKLAGQAQEPHPAMLEPGLKIVHSPDFDFRTTVPTLRLALRELRAWSEEFPDHEPVMVLLELKDSSFSPTTKPPRFDAAALRGLEAEILEEMPEARILMPDGVRGEFPSLRQAVIERGWPRLSEARGKFLFALDNEGRLRDDYLALSPGKDGVGRVLFTSVDSDHPAAGWMKRNDPLGGGDEIRKLVKAGFLVRTRADANLREAKANDRSRFEKAAATGAQWLSTDFPEPDPRWPDYQVAWPERAVFRVSPIEPANVKTSPDGGPPISPPRP